MFQKELLANPDSGIAHCHCPSISISPDGDILVAWYAYPEEETREGVLILAVRRAGRDYFDRSTRILPELRSSLGNPVLYFQADGTLHLLFVSLRGHYWDSAVINHTCSSDLGQTWAAPESLRIPPGIMIRHAPVLRGDGSLLLPAYDEKKNLIVMMTARPNSNDWQAVHSPDETRAIQACVVRQGERKLLALLRPCGSGRRCLRAISDDDGRTWSQVVKTSLPSPLSGSAAFQCDDALCAVYNHTTEHQRYPLSLAYSLDRGVSWSAPVQIDETQLEVSYPSFLIDARGVAHGVYSFHRSRIQYVRLDRTWWEG